MPVFYKVIQRPEPGVTGGGTKKWYASTSQDGEVDLDDLIHRVEKRSTMSGGDIKGVVYALMDVAIDELSQGRIVRMGELGDFRISISSMGHDTEEKVSAASIKRAKINYRSSRGMKKMLNNLVFRKRNSENS